MKLLEKISNKLKEWYGKYFITEIKKKSKLEKDVRLGVIIKTTAQNIKKDVRVVTKEGHGSIKDIKTPDFKWLVISFNHGKRHAEIKSDKVFQYYVRFYDPLTQRPEPMLRPLLYGDYKYIHPDTDGRNPEDWYEFHVSNKGYATLIDAEKERLSHMPYFNKNAHGQYLLCKIEEELLNNNLSLTLHKGKLLTIKN